MNGVGAANRYYITSATTNFLEFGYSGTGSSSIPNGTCNVWTTNNPLVYKYDSEFKIDLFPFIVKVKRELICNLNVIIKVEWIYSIFLEEKMIDYFSSPTQWTEDDLSKRLEYRAKAWLDNEMKSTWKTPTTPSK